MLEIFVLFGSATALKLFSNIPPSANPYIQSFITCLTLCSTLGTIYISFVCIGYICIVESSPFKCCRLHMLHTVWSSLHTASVSSNTEVIYAAALSIPFVVWDERNRYGSVLPSLFLHSLHACDGMLNECVPCISHWPCTLHPVTMLISGPKLGIETE